MGANTTSPVAEYVKQIIEETNLTQDKFAKKIGVSRQTLSTFLRGKSRLTSNIALGLSNFTNDPPDFWFALQTGKANLPTKHSPLLKKWKLIGQHTITDWELLEALHEELLSIEGFEKNGVQPASYDSQMGEALVNNHKDTHPELCNENNPETTLLPGATAVVHTYEKFTLPSFLIARIGSKSDLATNCIALHSGHHIDPGFNGRLRVALHNFGTEPYPLIYRETFLSLEFLFLPVEPLNLYEGKNQNRNGFSPDERQTVSANKQAPQGEFGDIIYKAVHDAVTDATKSYGMKNK